MTQGKAEGMTIENVVAQKVREALKSAFAEGDLWPLVDMAILDILKDQPKEEAQLWLAADGKHTVCVTIPGADEPYVCPFFVPEPNFPARYDFTEQVAETWGEVAALRTFARGLLKMAEQTEAGMAAMGLHCPDYAK